MACLAQLVADVLIQIDGVAYVPEEPREDCPEPVTHTVVIRREGIEIAAEMCREHEQVFHLHDDGYVRATRHYRT